MFKQLRGKNVLIIHQDGNYFANPSLFYFINTLLSSGVEVYLISRKLPSSHVKHNNLHVIEFGNGVLLIKKIIFDWIASPRLAKIAVFLYLYFSRIDIDHVIGVDREGLVVGSIIANFLGARFTCWSFEIFFESEKGSRFKRLERFFGRDLPRLIIQDSVRLDAFIEENHVDEPDVLLIPVAPSAVSDHGPVRQRLRDRLGIPQDVTVALVVGDLSYWTMIPEILNGVKSWPENWVLLLHSRYGDTAFQLQNKGIEIPNEVRDRVYLSDVFAVDVSEMGFIFDGVSVGLAFYKSTYNSAYTGKNVQLIGLSSGKIALYLKYGVPVILNDIGEYAESATENGFGLVLEHPRLIGDYIESMDIPRMGRSGKRYFTDFLAPENYGGSLSAFLSK